MLRIHRDKWRDFFTFKAKIPIRIIFKYRDIVTSYYVHEFFTSFKRHADSSWILIIRNQVNELYFWFLLKNLFQFFRNHPLVIGRYFNKSWSVQCKSINSSHIGWTFNKNYIILIQEDTSCHIQPLLRTSNHNNVLWIYFCHSHGDIHSVHTISNSFPKSHISLGRTILHGTCTIFFSYLNCYFCQFFKRESLWSRKSACKGNNVWLRNNCE